MTFPSKRSLLRVLALMALVTLLLMTVGGRRRKSAAGIAQVALPEGADPAITKENF